MKITFLGAAGGHVTGSAHLLETSRARVLVDFGTFQGEPGDEKQLNVVPEQLKPETLDVIVLTHAHLDHIGRLPLLMRAGWHGAIWATPATIDLVGLLLRDACRIHLQDLERAERKRQGAGAAPAGGGSGVKPVQAEAPRVPGAQWDERDVEAVLHCLRPAPYNTPYEVAPGVSVVMKEAGHILGSTHLRVTLEDGGQKKCVSFSGDLGPVGMPILRDLDPFFGDGDDMVLLESTYGDREHRSFKETVAQFQAILKDAVEAKAKVLIPSFAVGRAQLLVYLINEMFKAGELPEFPVYLDSPMAIEATRIYCHHPELHDEASKLLGGVCAIGSVKWLHPCPTADDSKRINDAKGPFVVLAGAGMCTGGRILHHLRHGLSNPGVHVVIAGFQAKGGLGRLLVDGKKTVSVLGDEVEVKAQIHTLGGFSAHAGRNGLINWMASAKTMAKKPRVMLVHGEDKPRQALASGLREKYDIQSHLPQMGEVAEL